jgi:hypothetical protein
MGLLGRVFNGGDTVKGALEGAGTLAKDLRAAITGENPELAAKAMELEAKLQEAQVDLNKTEAGSSSVFVAGWRPALGWTFAAIVALHYLVRPIAEWALRIFMPEVLPLPLFNLADIWPVLIGLLGLGTMRTAEKFGGVQDKH